ncbi:MAG: tRNA dihydrouridine synthase DusB [Bacteroidota bacterium]|nr:tRNA dihydrouridine synthase DusB [Bacteroidota bacterium]
MFKIGDVEIPHYPLILAPMEDITDPPFRQICKHYSVDLMYTEFVSSEALIRDAEKSLKKLDINNDERPIGIQIFGHDTDSMIKAAQAAERANPDIIDINFGCPVKKVVKKGAGAGILKDIPKMIAMTEAIVRSVKTPVTVKTRLGWDNNSKQIVEIAEQLQDVGIQGLTIHGRTRAQMYKGEADWTLIGDVKNNPRMHIPIIGNGDINSPEKAFEMRNKYGVDAIMIGRAAIGNPWLFQQIRKYLDEGILLPKPTLEERIKVCSDHLLKEIAWKGERSALLEMRKFYTGYFKGIPDFKQHKIKLILSDNINEIFSIFDIIIDSQN